MELYFNKPKLILKLVLGLAVIAFGFFLMFFGGKTVHYISGALIAIIGMSEVIRAGLQLSQKVPVIKIDHEILSINVKDYNRFILKDIDLIILKQYRKNFKTRIDLNIRKTDGKKAFYDISNVSMDIYEFKSYVITINEEIIFQITNK